MKRWTADEIEAAGRFVDAFNNEWLPYREHTSGQLGGVSAAFDHWVVNHQVDDDSREAVWSMIFHGAFRFSGDQMVIDEG